MLPLRKKLIHKNLLDKCSRVMTKNADDKFDTFRCVCEDIANKSSYLQKADVLRNFLCAGTTGQGFLGDLQLWVHMLIPGATQRVYNLQNKQMLKLFSRILHTDQSAMQLDLEQEGDVSETLRKFYAQSKRLKPCSASTLHLHDVESYLQQLEQRSKEDEQEALLRGFCHEATDLDLKMFIRLVKQDLRINARARHILDALDPAAYAAYQSSRDLAAVVDQFAGKLKALESTSPAVTKGKKNDKAKPGTSALQIMTPISPMLANACKSIDEAFKKSPVGLYSEVKYDGERVQIHKRGKEFKFFSRNLKPVMAHKVQRLTEFIPKAFPGGENMILDSEIILVDKQTGQMFPFGTLGAHKKKEHANAEVCLFVFDCILFNDEDLTGSTFCERRKILESHITPIKSYVQLSEIQFMKTRAELSLMTAKVLKANLEGVVLKSPSSTYQPGKRGWLKVKKDYLFDGKMADTADLVVLGAWYGSGKKGGLLSIFLMGCYDSRTRLWKTVTKVHSGLDDESNEVIHKELMEIMERADADNIPYWLCCKKPLVPDFLAKQPAEMPVWEITGAEFTKSDAHTANGISIRFPRITKLRIDKSAEQANDLAYLTELYEASKKNVNVDLLLKGFADGETLDEDTNNCASKVNSLELNATPKKKKPMDDDKHKAKRSKPSSDDGSGSSAGKARAKKELKDKTTVQRKKLKMEEFEDVAKTEDKPTPSESPKEAVKRKIEAADQEESTTSRKPSAISSSQSNSVTSESKTVNTPVGLQAGSGRDIFGGIIAYFRPQVNATKPLLDLIRQNGGKLTLNTRKATHVFHDARELKELTLNDVREAYSPTARHLHVTWVKESAEAGQLKEYPIYAVIYK